MKRYLLILLGCNFLFSQGIVEYGSFYSESLDENRNFIKDIYDSVNKKDGIWSEVIYDQEYIRATFEQELNSGNDLTIYARSANGISSSVEVYEEDGDELIATFENICFTTLFFFFIRRPGCSTLFR